MGIWSRLENVVKSYINDSGKKVFGEDRGWRNTGRAEDDDYKDAYEELEGFLKGEKASSDEGSSGSGSRDNSGTGGSQHRGRTIPRELFTDFEELGLPPTATKEQCKEAYKRLLKIHHPDRHAGHAANMKKATEKSARINASYDRLLKWFEVV